MSLVAEGKLKNDLTAPLKTPQRPRLVYKLSTLKSIRSEQVGLVCKPGRPVCTLVACVFLAPCDLASVARARGLSACLKIASRLYSFSFLCI